MTLIPGFLEAGFGILFTKLEPITLVFATEKIQDPGHRKRTCLLIVMIPRNDFYVLGCIRITVATWQKIQGGSIARV